MELPSPKKQHWGAQIGPAGWELLEEHPREVPVGRDAWLWGEWVMMHCLPGRGERQSVGGQRVGVMPAWSCLCHRRADLAQCTAASPPS